MKSLRGFAAMDKELQRQLSIKGGKSVSPQNRSFSKDRELASKAGKLGAASKNKSSSD